ncbi:MAG: electron transfer flavoprotein subunit beta [Deltaproteobacteria bacterium]|nr:MAG: electron transfer flavoprotein subunit beta [Deltaproteobacteria bacterium]
MEILVCLKQVPDTEADIRPTSDMAAIDYAGVKFIVNVYDEYAVEEALRLKEKVGGKVTIVCLGPDRAVEAIRTALAMGADEAVHLNDPALLEGDAYTTALALAKVIQGMAYDVIFCGKQAIDDDLAQVPSILGEMLGIPTVTNVQKFELVGDKKAKVHRQVEGGLDVIELQLPAIFTATKGLNEPRYPSLPGIMKAKKKPLKALSLSDLGLSEDQVGSKGALMKVVKYSLPPMRQAGKIVDGETPEEKAAKLVKLLREEAKVI